MKRAPGLFDRTGHRISSKDGFTMVELLVVLAIIGMIATFAVPQVLGYLESARIDAARIQIRNIEGAMDLYYIDNARYPESEDGIAALSVAPPDADRWNGPYLKKADTLLDPWGNQYLYELDEKKSAIKILSLGSDGKIGGDAGAADISNRD